MLELFVPAIFWNERAGALAVTSSSSGTLSDPLRQNGSLLAPLTSS